MSDLLFYVFVIIFSNFALSIKILRDLNELKRLNE